MYCSSCGKHVADDAHRCEYCGANVNVGGQQNNGYGNAYDNFGGNNYNNGYGYNNNGYYNPNQYNNQNQQMQGGQNSTYAILGFVFAFLMPLIGLILSIIAFRASKQTNNNEGRSLSLAGIIISSIYMGIILLYVIFIVIAIIVFANQASMPPLFLALI